MGLKILFVEDDKNLNMMLRLILRNKKRDWEFRGAHDGVEALEILEGYKADLAVVDLEMPRMNGLELVQKIKADPKLAQCRLAVLSSSSDETIKDQVRAAGVHDIWMKPIFPDALFARIDAMLS